VTIDIASHLPGREAYGGQVDAFPATPARLWRLPYPAPTPLPSTSSSPARLLALRSLSN